MTAISMVIITGIVAANEGDVSRVLPLILSIFLLVGLVLVGLGLVGMGKYIKYIPYPVVSGFMTAIGVIIIITQIIPSLGYYPKTDTAFVNQFKPQAEEAIVDDILKEEAAENINVIEGFEETIRRAKVVTPEQILAAKESSGVVGAVKMLPRAVKNINWLELLLSVSTIGYNQTKRANFRHVSDTKQSGDLIAKCAEIITPEKDSSIKKYRRGFFWQFIVLKQSLNIIRTIWFLRSRK